MKWAVILIAVVVCEASPRATFIERTERSDYRVIGGSDANIANYPYQCSLRFSGSHTCGCSVLNANVMLTAAHCVDGRTASGFSVLAGQTNRLVGTAIGASSYVMNSAYDSGASGMPNDIATVTLNSGLDLGNSNIAAAALPPNNNDQFAGDMCTITGWGRTGTSNVLPDTLQMLDIPVISNTECTSRMSGVGGATISAGHICIYSGSNGACNGDSGGPLACSGMVTGVTSWVVANALGNCLVSYPSVYTRTSYFLSWIDNNS